MMPCVFNNWAVFYDGKFVTVNQMDGAMVEKLLKSSALTDFPQKSADKSEKACYHGSCCGRADALAANQAEMAEREWHEKGLYIW